MARRLPLPSQRWIVLIGLALLCLMLHTTFCEWRFRDRYPHAWNDDDCIVGIVHESNVRQVIMSGGGQGQAYYHDVVTGVYSQDHDARKLSLFCGVIVPFLLVGAALYLHLGWRYADRIARGLCPQCRYDLRGDRNKPQDTCPECGWTGGEKRARE